MIEDETTAARTAELQLAGLMRQLLLSRWANDNHVTITRLYLKMRLMC